MKHAINNRTMPSCTIIPILEYDNVADAIDWLTKTFGFTERWRADIHRAQISFDDSTIVIIPSSGKVKRVQSLIVQVNDIELHYQRVKNMGAKILQEPADFPYGERQYSVEDLYGHTWLFSQSIRDVMPEEWGGSTHSL